MENAHWLSSAKPHKERDKQPEQVEKAGIITLQEDHNCEIAT